MFGQFLRDILLIAFVLSLFRLLISDKKNKQLIERVMYLVFLLSIVSMIGNASFWQRDRFIYEEVEVNEWENKYLELGESILVADMEETLSQAIDEICTPMDGVEFVTVKVYNPKNDEALDLDIVLKTETENEQAVMTMIERGLIDDFAIDKEALNFIFK